MLKDLINEIEAERAPEIGAAVKLRRRGYLLGLRVCHCFMVTTFKERITMISHVFAVYETADLQAAAEASYLIEGGRVWELDKRWSVRMDRGHTPGMQDHLYIMLRGWDVSIINRDGTQSHNTNRDGVPNWLIDKIKSRGLIEGTLIVDASREPIRIPKSIIDRMRFRARITDLLTSRAQ